MDVNLNYCFTLRAYKTKTLHWIAGKKINLLSGERGIRTKKLPFAASRPVACCTRTAPLPASGTAISFDRGYGSALKKIYGLRQHIQFVASFPLIIFPVTNVIHLRF